MISLRIGKKKRAKLTWQCQRRRRRRRRTLALPSAPLLGRQVLHRAVLRPHLTPGTNPLAAPRPPQRDQENTQSESPLGFLCLPRKAKERDKLGYLTASGVKRRACAGAKRSRDRFSDRRLSFFRDCGSTGGPSAAAAVAIAATADCFARRAKTASISFCFFRSRSKGGLRLGWF